MRHPQRRRGLPQRGARPLTLRCRAQPLSPRLERGETVLESRIDGRARLRAVVRLDESRFRFRQRRWRGPWGGGLEEPRGGGGVGAGGGPGASPGS